MTDPLSIAAGVVGILSAAADISSVLIKFTSTVKDAPKQAQVVATEVSDVNGILSHLQSFLLGTESYDRSRFSLLRIDQLVTLVGSCVLTFSELEKILHELKIEGMGFLNCIGWARKETVIMGLIQRLQNHKASLSLILNMLNGNTILEAKFSIDRLHVLMEDYHKDMVSRVQDLEQRERRWLGDESSILEQDDSASIKTVTGNAPDFSSFEFGFAESGSLTDIGFIEDLENSWVYKRNGVCRETASAFSITDAHSTTWSCLSSLSVAEVSNISVINLPITVNEVFNSWRFSQTWSGNPRGPAGSSHPPDNIEASQNLEMQKVEAHICRRCEKLIKDGILYECGGQHWHFQCFQCEKCNALFNSNRYTNFWDDDLWIYKNCVSCDALGETNGDINIAANIADVVNRVSSVGIVKRSAVDQINSNSSLSFIAAYYPRLKLKANYTGPPLRRKKQKGNLQISNLAT